MITAIVILQTILSSVGSEDTTTDFTAFDGSGKIGDLQSSDGTILAHTSHTPNAGPVFDIGGARSLLQVIKFRK